MSSQMELNAEQREQLKLQAEANEIIYYKLKELGLSVRTIEDIGMELSKLC